MNTLSTQEKQFIHNGSLVDFLIIDPKGNLLIATIEIDGESFHQAASRQAERDTKTLSWVLSTFPSYALARTLHQDLKRLY